MMQKANQAMLIIDGSFGEGGGQILRSSLALSLVTGKPFRIQNIRAGRKKPGLMRQHLTAVNAAVEVGAAEVHGNEIGSGELSFIPHAIHAGDFHFAVGTAGSTTLVLQTVLPALLMADRPSRVVLEGGTHNPFAPPFCFLEKVFMPVIRRMGPEVAMVLERPGFYPAGGGRITVEIQPRSLRRVDLLERGEIMGRSAKAYVANLPAGIAQRELKVVKKKLNWPDECHEVITIDRSAGPGNIVTVELQCEQVTELFTGFGMKAVPAEKVPVPMIKTVQEYLAADVPVARYLADQLLIPMAMAGGGRFRTLPLTLHARTNIEIMKQFLDVQVEVVQLDGRQYEVGITV